MNILSLLVLLCHKWRIAAGTSLKRLHEGARQSQAQALDGIRHVTLWPDRGRRGVCNRRVGQGLGAW